MALGTTQVGYQEVVQPTGQGSIPLGLSGKVVSLFGWQAVVVAETVAVTGVWDGD